LNKKHFFLFISFIFTVIIVVNIGFTAGTGKGLQEVKAAASEEQETGTEDINVVPLYVTGSADERLNLIIFGDGYTAEEMDKYREDVDRNQNVLWSVEPFRSYQNYFNVYMVETPSVESGISCDPDDGNIRRDTVFNLQYARECPADELARGVTFGAGGSEQRNEIMREYVAPHLGISPDAQNIQTLTIANTFTYGGIGGVHATTTGGSPQGPLVSIHELGHSLGNLQDEYPYSSRETPGRPYPDEEPASVHHTRMSSEEMIENEAKWWRWLGEESESGGIIRAADPDGYEGGHTRGSNVWRPSEHSMMRHTGFYFDQVSREHMTQRITGMRDAAVMPLSSTPEGEIGTDNVVWVEPMNPRFHTLDVTWEINEEVVTDTHNSRHLDLAELDVTDGDTVKVTVQDKTSFVRNPEHLESSKMTQTREWVVGESLPEADVDIQFTNSSPTERAMAHDEVVYVETANPNDRMLTVTWKLNGEKVPNPHNSRVLELSNQDLPEGASELSAILTDPEDPTGDKDIINWTVDNGMPEAPRTLSEPLAVLPGEQEHNVYFNEFDMLLEPEDDQDGFIVGELRLNESGWYNYYGFPEETNDAPFNFSHSGTDIKALTYGNLGSGGLSKITFEQSFTEDDPGGAFVPGFGTHMIEHRAHDAAGNIGEAGEFHATVLPGESPACAETITGEYEGNLLVTEDVTCLNDAEVSGDISVEEDASLVVSNSLIKGDLNAANADAVQLFGTTVTGEAKIYGTSRDVTLAGNTFNSGITLFDNNQTSVNEQFGDYGPILAGNNINGLLVCIGNSSQVSDFGAANMVNGTEVEVCGEASALKIMALVDLLEETGEFADDNAIRAVKTHLTAVNRFEQLEQGEKVVRHMEGFKFLLDHQFNDELISEKAYRALMDYSGQLIKKWE